MECELFAMASGLKWENVGSQKPEQGREISNSKLAKALQEKTQFTASEWSAFHISELQSTAVIEVKGKDGDVSYFRPAAIDEKVEALKEQKRRMITGAIFCTGHGGGTIVERVCSL